MIENVKIKNFQSLEEVIIELGKFTVIVGESECGKSAFIRAIYKMTTNGAVKGSTNGEPWSNITPGAKDVVVALEADGHLLVWVKGENNVYKIDGSSLSKVGRDCPEEVQALLKMPEVVFDERSRYHLNFQMQFDLPFLVDEAGTRVAKVLGDLTNVNLLMNATREANRQRLSTAKTITIEKDRIGDLRKKIQRYKRLPDAAKMIEATNASAEQLKEALATSKDCLETTQRLATLENAVVAADDIARRLKVFTTINLTEIEDKIAQSKDMRLMLDKLEVVGDNARIAAQADIEAERKLADAQDKLYIFLQNNPTCPLCEQRLLDEQVDKLVNA